MVLSSEALATLLKSEEESGRSDFTSDYDGSADTSHVNVKTTESIISESSVSSFYTMIFSPFYLALYFAVMLSPVEVLDREATAHSHVYGLVIVST